MDCSTCKNRHECYLRVGEKGYFKLLSCSRYELDETKPMTNGDRIRAMTDEELAYNFEYSTICGRIQNSNPEWCGTNGECRNCVLRWLKQPAEVDHDTY